MSISYFPKHTHSGIYAYQHVFVYVCVGGLNMETEMRGVMQVIEM